MELHWPQVTWIVLSAMSMGQHLAKDGEPRGNYSFWWALFSCLLANALLLAGGFFGR